MGFDDNDWGIGSEQGLNLAPTEEKGEIVIDINSPETITSQLRKGLNNTPTRLGFYDGTQWTNYFSSDGFFRVGTINNSIEYDPNTDETTFTGTINASKLGLGTTLEIPFDTLGQEASLKYGGVTGSFYTTGGGTDLYTFSRGVGGLTYNIGIDPLFLNVTNLATINLRAVTIDLRGLPTNNSTSYGSLVLQNSGAQLSAISSLGNLRVNLVKEDAIYIESDADYSDALLYPNSGVSAYFNTDGFSLAKDSFTANYSITNNYGITNNVSAPELARANMIRPDSKGQLWISRRTTLWDLNAVMVEVPPHNNSTGLKSQLSHDDDYLYVCIQDNSWKRIAFDAGTW